MSIRLLDCTLRDGGYINDWKFGYRTAKSIIQKLVIPTRTTWKSVFCETAAMIKTQRCSIILRN